MRFSNELLGEDECKGLKSLRVGEVSIIQGKSEKRGECQQGWRNLTKKGPLAYEAGEILDVDQSNKRLWV